MASVVVALAWAGLDAVRKSLSADVAPTVLVAWLTLGQVPFLAIWWTTTLSGGPSFVDLGGYAPPAIASAVLGIAANVGFVQAVKMAPLSSTIPMLAWVPVASVALGWIALGEMPGPIALVGIGFVAAGAVALDVGDRGSPPTEDPARARRGRWLMAAVAVGWAATLALDKLALRHATAPAHATMLALAMGTMICLGLVGRGRGRELVAVRSIAPRLALAVVIAAVAFGLQLWAVRLVFVSTLEAIKRALGITASVVVGRLVFGERPTSRQLLAVAAMTVGAVLVIGGPLLFTRPLL